MAPTEAEILENFLLPPAPFQNIITFKEFAALFPRSARDHPELTTLYGEMEEQRSQDIIAVKEGIKSEVKKGKEQKRKIARARRQAEKKQREAFGIEETRLDTKVSGFPIESYPYSLGFQKRLSSFETDEEYAAFLVEFQDKFQGYEKELLADMADMQKEYEQLSKDIFFDISEFSDLKYGRWKPSVREELGEDAILAIRRFAMLCKETRKASGGEAPPFPESFPLGDA
jgi:centromere-localized protein 2